MSEDILDLAPPPAAVTVAYGPAPEQFGDLRLPVGPGPHPVAIMLHGGYWRARYDLRYLGHICAALARRGIATWNVEYRRVGDPDGGWPATFIDVALAADFLRTLARAHALDLGRVIALGHSAGGHLALWLAARPRIAAEDPLHATDPLTLRAAVALAGVVDLRRAWELHLSNNATGALMGGSPGEFPERYATASPYDLLPLGVAQHLIHGSADTNVPIELSSRYVAQAVARGDDATLLTLPGAGHFEVVDPRAREWPQVEQIIVEAALG